MTRKRRGRGEGGIFQRGDGRWVGTLSMGYNNAGKRKRQTVYGSSKADVVARVDKLKQRMSNGMVPEAGAITISSFLDQWLEAAKSSIAKGTHAGYEQHVRNLIKPILGGVRLSKLNALHVQNLYKSLAENQYSTAMQRKAGITFSVALSWGVVMNLLSDNPAKRVKLPKHRQPEVKALEPDQVALFLKSARQDRLFALYPLAIDSGCRQGELLALTWRDIDFDRGTVSITKSLEEVGGDLAIKSTKTEKARRTITVSVFTLEALQEHRKVMLAEGSYKSNGPVFCGSRNKTYLRKSDIYRHSFEPLLKRAGLVFRFHDLRHSTASMLLMGGSDIKTVQERLGHSTATMTLNTYSHVMQGTQSEAARKLNAILSNADRGSAVQTG